MSRGIDYAGHSITVNRDPSSGIRYGVIPLNATGEFAHEAFESEYDPSCPHCGAELDDSFESPAPCPHCGIDIGDGEQFGDEPSRQVLVEEGYEGFLDSSNDIWVTRSPYYTRASFCSPCAPGACYLTQPCKDGEKAFCLGPDWFDDEAPYPIYKVEEDTPQP